MTKTPKNRRTKTARKVPAKSYTPTPAEQTALDKVKERNRALSPLPTFTLQMKDGEVDISYQHEDKETARKLLAASFGASMSEYSEALIAQMTRVAAAFGDAEARETYHLMQTLLVAVEPRDELEAMLAAQMATIHSSTMRMARSLVRAETLDQQNSAERALNKLARTFAAQMEALNRHRGKGQQEVTVKHVNVHDGGQAIVGVVNGAGDKMRAKDQTHDQETVAHAPVTPMRGEEQTRESEAEAESVITHRSYGGVDHKRPS